MRDVKLLKERARSTQYKQHSPQRPVGQWVMAVGIFGFGLSWERRPLGRLKQLSRR